MDQVLEDERVRLRPTSGSDLATARSLFTDPGFYERWDGAPKTDDEIIEKYLGAPTTDGVILTRAEEWP